MNPPRRLRVHQDLIAILDLQRKPEILITFRHNPTGHKYRYQKDTNALFQLDPETNMWQWNQDPQIIGLLLTSEDYIKWSRSRRGSLVVKGEGKRLGIPKFG